MTFRASAPGVRAACVGAVIFLAVLLGSIDGAFASPIVTYTFSGTVTTGSIFMPSLPTGTNVTFSVPFDLGAPDKCAQPSTALYVFPGSTVSYGGGSYTSLSTALEANAPDGNCSNIYLANYTLRLLGFSGAPFVSATMDFSSMPLNGDLPPVFGPGDAGLFSLNYVGNGFGGPGAAMGGAAAVPEPVLSLLVAVGAGAALRRGARCGQRRL